MIITIIGGGAAGLMTAAALHEFDQRAEVFIFEKNDALGKKVIISGGGRCNVTTGIPDIKIVLTKYPRGSKFLSSAMSQFPPLAVIEWFESRGIKLKTENDQRIFPLSNNGREVVGAFENIFRNSPIHTMLKTQVVKVEKNNTGFNIFLKGQTKPFVTNKLILTTGGQAYRHTGSTGDGYAFAIALGHSLTKLAPSLSSLLTKELWPGEVAGLSFFQAELKLSKKQQYNASGPFIFTHKGISGPAIFALSSLAAFEYFSPDKPLKLTVDLFPTESIEKLRTLVRAANADNPKKTWTNVLTVLAPKSLVTIMCRELKLPCEKHAGEISKKEIDLCLIWLKNIPLHIVGRGVGDEFVTAGGINLKEVNPKTMESKICPGLYLAGEILDIDGFTGGFNLQAAWATGRVAGENAARTS